MSVMGRVCPPNDIVKFQIWMDVTNFIKANNMGFIACKLCNACNVVVPVQLFLMTR